MPTCEHTCEICGIRRFGDKIVHGIFGAERSVELARDGGKRPVRRFVRCTTAHVQLRCTAETRCPRCRWIGYCRRILGAFDLEFARRPMIYFRVSAPHKKEMGVALQSMARQERGQRLTHQECSGSYLKTSRTVRTTSESLRSTRKVSSAQRWKTPCVPVVPIPLTMSAVMRNGTHSGIVSSFPLFNNSCEITAVKGYGERYLLECDAEINVYDFARATIQENIRYVSVAQTEDVSNDRCRRNAPCVIESHGKP
jgi:hypothetical protein